MTPAHDNLDKHDGGHPAFAEHPPADAHPQRPSPELLLWAYGHSLFPMADSRSAKAKISWFSPDPRGIFPLQPEEAFHIPQNLARLVRQDVFEIRSDTAFEETIRACAEPRKGERQTWLNEHIITSYLALHRMGHAHSVEAWRDGRLVGGLYGVQIGGAYFGESMFSRPELGGSNSSKVCLVHLVNRLRSRGFALLDTQFANDHLQQFGCVEIPAEEYFAALQKAIRLPATWD